MDRPGSNRQSGVVGPDTTRQAFPYYMRILQTVAAVLAATILTSLTAWAQTVPGACTGTYQSGTRVLCQQDATSTDPIDVSLQGIAISTTITKEPAVYLEHKGTGKISLRADDLDGTTTGQDSHGLHVLHEGSGDIDIDVINESAFKVKLAYGISVIHKGDSGQIEIDISGTEITTEGTVYDADAMTDDYSGFGISVLRQGASVADGADVRLTVRDSTIVTAGWASSGIAIRHQASGVSDVLVEVYGSSISTNLVDETQGVRAWRSPEFGGSGNVEVHVEDSTLSVSQNGNQGIFAYNTSVEGTTGNTSIKVLRGSTSTTGRGSHGVYGWYQNFDGSMETGNVTIELTETAVTTVGAGAHGVYGVLQNSGDLIMSATDGSISTQGAGANALYGVAYGAGDMTITTGGRNRITTTGQDARGIIAFHLGSDTIEVTIGGTVDVQGLDAHGVQIGILNADGAPERASAIGEDGYRRQTVRINGAVAGGSGSGVGIYLAGGGRVIIGPSGSVTARSGIAILATGDTPSDIDGEPAIKPRLLVEIDLDGRRVASAIGDDWIINDGGETTIAINGVVLHDGATGVVPGAVAQNGAWKITIRAQGVTVDLTDPSNWIVSERDDIVFDRDFSGQDLNERAPPKPKPKPEPEEPEPDEPEPKEPEPEPEPEPELPTFVERYAPRAAIYEALPVFLLGLEGRSREVVRWAGAGAWARLSGGFGYYDPAVSEVGARFDSQRLEAEVGIEKSILQNLVGSVSLRGVQGMADVQSAFGGGAIGADGIGVEIGAALDGAALSELPDEDRMGVGGGPVRTTGNARSTAPVQPLGDGERVLLRGAQRLFVADAAARVPPLGECVPHLPSLGCGRQVRADA